MATEKEMHELIGPTKVDWREGIRRQIENLAPDLLKKGSA